MTKLLTWLRKRLASAPKRKTYYLVTPGVTLPKRAYWVSPGLSKVILGATLWHRIGLRDTKYGPVIQGKS